MARGYEPEEFIGRARSPRSANAKPNSHPAMTSRVTKCGKSVHRGQVPIPIPTWLARLSCARSTKSGAGPIVCGDRKSQRWWSSANSEPLPRRI